MTNPNEEIGKVFDQLKQLRDELALKVHLATMDAKDEWQELEQKWSDFESKAKLSETGEGVERALSQLGEELKAGYERIRKAL